MAAETPALYTAADAALFDAGRLVHTLKESRTVGEMLHDADHLSRQLLFNVTGDDAGPLLRSWPALVDAGSQLWEALPRRRYDPNEGDLPMQRLVATTSAFTESLGRPVAGPGRGRRTPASHRSARRYAPRAPWSRATAPTYRPTRPALRATSTPPEPA